MPWEDEDLFCAAWLCLGSVDNIAAHFGSTCDDVIHMATSLIAEGELPPRPLMGTIRQVEDTAVTIAAYRASRGDLIAPEELSRLGEYYSPVSRHEASRLNRAYCGG
jgi:hypothetical protein